MAENVIEAALRIGHEKRRSNAAIESLVILAESDLPQAERKRLVAEWRRLRLL